MENVTGQTKEAQIDEILQLNVQIFRAFQSGNTALLLNSELTMAQLKILFILFAEKSVSVGQVAEKLGVGIPATSYQIDKIVQAGLVVRVEDSGDRRRTLLSLSAEGEHLLRQFTQGRVEHIRSIIRQMTEEEVTHLLLGFQALTRITRSCEKASQFS